jgi:hypothetical protein
MNATAERPETNDLENSTGITNPLVLLDKMIEKGIDPEALKQMMDLSERWEANQAKKAYQLAMTACQHDMPTVIRDALNRETNKKFAPLETVSLAIKPTYTRHGFSLSFSTADSPREGHYRVVCDLMHSGGHTTHHFLDVPIDNKGPKGAPNKTDTQGAISAMSYGQRKLTTMMFNVTVADEDRDGQGGFLSSGQVMAINNTIQALKSAEAIWTATGDALPEKYTPFNSNRFYDVYLAKSLADFPSAKFDDAMNTLDRKLNQLRKDGAP